MSQREDKVQRTFTTFGFFNYTKQICEQCMVCAKHNVQGNLKPKPGKLESPSYPFDIIAMDFIELSMCQQKKYCLVIIDCFSKWVEIFPTAKADAKTVVKAMTHWIHF